MKNVPDLLSLWKESDLRLEKRVNLLPKNLPNFSHRSMVFSSHLNKQARLMTAPLSQKEHRVMKHQPSEERAALYVSAFHLPLHLPYPPSQQRKQIIQRAHAYCQHQGYHLEKRSICQDTHPEKPTLSRLQQEM